MSTSVQLPRVRIKKRHVAAAAVAAAAAVEFLSPGSPVGEILRAVVRVLGAG